MFIEPGINNSDTTIRDFWRGKRCFRLRTIEVIK
jgi:hypothetical protein